MRNRKTYVSGTAKPYPSRTAGGEIFARVVRSFTEHSTVWAEVDPVAGEFRLAAGRTGQTVTHRITLRAGPELTAETRLRHGTRVYEIRSVYTADPEERFLVALTEEMTG